MKKVSSLLAISLLISGCATTQISTEERSKLNRTQADLKAEPVALITDACLIRSELGTSLIEGEQSLLTAEKFTELLQNKLNQNGVAVNSKFIPFVCGFMPEDQLKKYDYKVDNDTKRAEITQFPLKGLTNVALTVQQQQVLLAFNQSFNQWQASNIKNAQEKKPVSNYLALSNEDIIQLKSLTQSNYVLVSSLTGIDASFGKKFAAGALSVGVSLATVGAGTGLVTAYIPKEGQHFVIYIVDLDKKEVRSTTAGIFTGKPYSYKQHSVEVKDILNPLFEDTKK